MSATSSPSTTSWQRYRILRLIASTLGLFILAGLYDVSVFVQALSVATEHHGKNELNSYAAAAAESLLVRAIGLQVVVVIALALAKWYAQAVAAASTMLLLLLLMGVLYYFYPSL